MVAQVWKPVCGDCSKIFSRKFGDKCHLDDSAAQQGFAEQKPERVVITIGGKKHWLWRAVELEGIVLDVLVQSRRNTKAAKRLMRKFLKAQGHPPRVIITDKLRSYDAAKRSIMPGVKHRSHVTALWGLNNRAKNSHLPIRRREKTLKRFKSARHLQLFVSIHDPIASLFHLPRHDCSPTDRPSTPHRLRFSDIGKASTVQALFGDFEPIPNYRNYGLGHESVEELL